MSDENGSEKDTASTCEIVSITEAARRLDCSVRTVQRRLDKGTLDSIEVDGQRRVKLPHDRATANATRDTTGRQSDATPGTPSNATTRQNDAPQRDIKHELARDTPRHDTRQMARHDATDSATRDTTNATSDGRVIEILERENAFLKSQIESANRATAEAHAALRAALAAMPKALNEGNPQVLAADINARETMPQVLAGATPDEMQPEFRAFDTTATNHTTETKGARNSGTVAHDGRGFRGFLLKLLRG